MRRVIVRYTVKPGHEAVNEKLVRAIYDELHQTQPTGLRYATFRLDDGRTFVHVAVDETPQQRNPLLEVAAFRRFTDGVAGRCEIPPQAAEADQTGGYRLFGN
jgi:hypothetical protein